ncbi:MAG: PAS domain-containing sensor histidine kinase [Alphaproteobacteria bacterium]
MGAALCHVWFGRKPRDRRTADLETLQAVIDAVPAIINCKDLASRYVFMNAYQARLYGTTSGRAVGRTADELLGHSYGAYTRGIDQQVIATGEPVDSIEESYADAAGVMRSWLTTKVPLKDSRGHVSHIVTVAVDITQRKAIERELSSAKQNADAADRMKDTFLANMSHELRTPLNAILGFAELIEQNVYGPDAIDRHVDAAKRIGESGRHLLQIVSDILDLSKIAAGRFELRDERVDVTAIVRSVFDTLDSTAAGKGVALSIDGGSAPLWIEADPRACRQILLNLTSNAIKFTPSGGRVTVRAMIDPDGQPAVVVKDTGIGMEPDEVPAALEPFRQLDDSTARRFTGSGLGLSIAESLVRLLGGVLDIETARGRGTTVTVRLPPQRLKTSA